MTRILHGLYRMSHSDIRLLRRALRCLREVDTDARRRAAIHQLQIELDEEHEACCRKAAEREGV